jgi:hypothetical protein
MHRISSRATFFHKRIFPVLWFGILAFFMAMPFLAPLTGGTTTGSPVGFVLGPAIMMIIGYFMMKKLVFSLVDEVLDAGDALVVRNGQIEERIALSDIINVSYSQSANPAHVTLLLRNPTQFGDQITFCAPASSWPFSTSPIINELIKRIDAARRTGPASGSRPGQLR